MAQRRTQPLLAEQSRAKQRRRRRHFVSFVRVSHLGFKSFHFHGGRRRGSRTSTCCSLSAPANLVTHDQQTSRPADQQSTFLFQTTTSEVSLSQQHQILAGKAIGCGSMAQEHLMRGRRGKERSPWCGNAQILDAS